MAIRRFIVCAILTAVFVPVRWVNVAEANEVVWPQFRGPGGLGIAPDEKTYPTTLDSSNNLLLKTPVPE